MQDVGGVCRAKRLSGGCCHGTLEKATTHSMNCFFFAKPKPRLIEIKGLRACRMLEVYAEPKDCLEDVAMAQWEEASVITVRGTVRAEGNVHVQNRTAGCGRKPSSCRDWHTANMDAGMCEPC